MNGLIDRVNQFKEHFRPISNKQRREREREVLVVLETSNPTEFIFHHGIKLLMLDCNNLGSESLAGC